MPKLGDPAGVAAEIEQEARATEAGRQECCRCPPACAIGAVHAHDGFLIDGGAGGLNPPASPLVQLLTHSGVHPFVGCHSTGQRRQAGVDRVSPGQIGSDAFIQLQVAREQNRMPGARILGERDQFPAQQGRLHREGLTRVEPFGHR